MPKVSSNKWTKKRPKVADKGWNGQNLHDALPPGFEDPLSGGPFGILEPGKGIGHFKNLDE